jgi:hypothetical protein
MMNFLGCLKWPSILGLTHGRHISIVVKDVLVPNIDPPFYNRFLDVRENTKEFNYGLTLPRSLTNRITQLNKVHNIPEKRTMKRGTCK